MRDMLPLLQKTDFPAINRAKLETLQINLGYKCNQACLHCHVNASPKRKEQMDRNTMEVVLKFLATSTARTLDLTGGAPELNPHFRELVTSAYGLGIHIMDRCNLTILQEPEQEDTAEFLAQHRVEVVASLPCYLEENVNEQRGDGVFASSIEGIRKLNALGYGVDDSGLELNLVYNPIGPYLPPSQDSLETDYKRELGERYGIAFNRLYTITNMPIARFGSTLISKGEFDDYMNLLKGAYSDNNLESVMCKNLISADYRGYLYDCDFNQMLNIPISNTKPKTHLRDLIGKNIENNPIRIADHCYGCTAGQGSSCGGALL